MKTRHQYKLTAPLTVEPGIRMPLSLHLALTHLAKQHGRSLNMECVYALREYVELESETSAGAPEGERAIDNNGVPYLWRQVPVRPPDARDDSAELPEMRDTETC